MISKSLYDCLLDLINEELEKNLWSSNDKFSDIKKLSIDQRGRVGEHFFELVFRELNILNKYVNNAHGDWDIEADGLKIEIKTATLDINRKFQHEGIKENKTWDVVAFLDIAPNEIYVSFIHKNNFTFGLNNFKNNESIKHGEVWIYGKKQNIHFRGKDNTNRRATGAGYKVDFYQKDLKKVETIKDIENLFIAMKKEANLK